MLLTVAPDNQSGSSGVSQSDVQRMAVIWGASSRAGDFKASTSYRCRELARLADNTHLLARSSGAQALLARPRYTGAWPTRCPDPLIGRGAASAAGSEPKRHCPGTITEQENKHEP